MSDEFYEVELTIENDVIGNTVLYRPQGNAGDYEELDIWYGSLLDYVGDAYLKRMFLINLINVIKRDIKIYEDQLIGLTEIELGKRWIRRDLCSFYTIFVPSRGELLRKHIDEEKRDLEKYARMFKEID
jgi:hypothetical protein